MQQRSRSLCSPPSITPHTRYTAPVYFKCLDDATFFAVNSVVFDVFVLTVTFNIVLVRPVTAGRISARGRLVHTSRSLYLAEAELRDESQKLVATGSGTFMRSKITLGPEVGYVT